MLKTGKKYIVFFSLNVIGIKIIFSPLKLVGSKIMLVFNVFLVLEK
jgi:hypothetical protein